MLERTPQSSRCRSVHASSYLLRLIILLALLILLLPLLAVTARRITA